MTGNRPGLAYWTGVVMVIACIVIVFSEHTPLVREMKLAGLPLVWVAGGVAILSILVHELTDSVRELRPKIRRQRPEAPTGVYPPRKPALEDSSITREAPEHAASLEDSWRH
jgi:hypothetical protein